MSLETSRHLRVRKTRRFGRVFGGLLGGCVDACDDRGTNAVENAYGYHVGKAVRPCTNASMTTCFDRRRTGCTWYWAGGYTRYVTQIKHYFFSVWRVAITKP